MVGTVLCKIVIIVILTEVIAMSEGQNVCSSLAMYSYYEVSELLFLCNFFQGLSMTEINERISGLQQTLLQKVGCD
jgi:hypothetical protein